MDEETKRKAKEAKDINMAFVLGWTNGARPHSPGSPPQKTLITQVPRELEEHYLRGYKAGMDAFMTAMREEMKQTLPSILDDGVETQIDW